MAAGKEYAFSSPFDGMLDHDRKRLDRLYGGSDGDRASPVTTSRSSPAAPSRTIPRTGRPERAPSDPAMILDQRFGDGWRHEVVERRRDGNDMAVRCRLTVAADGIDVTRSGRAPIDAASVRPAIIGSADGVPFSFRSEDVTGADGAEQDAGERALADALAKCVDAI